jgi:hypothetical protein
MSEMFGREEKTSNISENFVTSTYFQSLKEIGISEYPQKA